MGMTLGKGKSCNMYVNIRSDKPTTSTTDGTVVEMYKTNFTIATKKYKNLAKALRFEMRGKKLMFLKVWWSSCLYVCYLSNSNITSVLVSCVYLLLSLLLSESEKNYKYVTQLCLCVSMYVCELAIYCVHYSSTTICPFTVKFYTHIAIYHGSRPPNFQTSRLKVKVGIRVLLIFDFWLELRQFLC